jgi:hypothetical protein
MVPSEGGSMKIILYFDDHAPVSFVGNSWECQLQVANSRHYPGFPGHVKPGDF